MSRVQKGGLVFKPVAKARARATSTAPKPVSSSATETHASSAPQISSTPSGESLGDSLPSSMPPPASLPSSNVPTTSQPVASTSRAPPAIVPSSSRIAAPPLIMGSSSRTPAPPVIIARPATTPNPTPTLVNNESGPSSTFTSTQDTLVPTPPSPAKKQPARARAKADTEGEATDVEPEKPKKGKKTPAKKKKKAVETDDATEEAPKKAKRKRATKKAAETATDGDATENDDVAEKPKRPQRKRAKMVVMDDEETEGDDGDDTPKPKRAKRKRAAKKEGEDDDDEVVRPRRKRKPKLPDFDPEADPGEEIDPTVITMAELCVDTGQGRVSSKAAEIQKNHLAWKEQSREKRARMKALAEQKKYGRPEDPDDAPAPATAADPEAPAAEKNAAVVVGSATGDPAIADASGSGFDYSQELTASRFTVQVRLGPNGETIIDEESLTVDRTEEVDTSNYVHVVESDQTKFVNSQSYTKKLRGSRWSAEETDLFFDALAQHGENYELLSLVLPGRTRTACKNKFKAEDKKDSAKITRILESQQPIDMNTLGRLTGRDFSGPVPIIKAPTPPPAPDRTMEPEPEPEATTAHVVRKRSRSRTAKLSSEGLEILGTVDTYDDKD